uniref:Uncharacterized protein n=1 Tax=Meloidogyne enterolobii TaxID=390850 RepID=A0A6V7XUE0_MELEN|nr:unnamed protein product [Meloidogyne enterolobii]
MSVSADYNRINNWGKEEGGKGGRIGYRYYNRRAKSKRQQEAEEEKRNFAQANAALTAIAAAAAAAQNVSVTNVFNGCNNGFVNNREEEKVGNDSNIMRTTNTGW